MDFLPSNRWAPEPLSSNPWYSRRTPNWTPNWNLPPPLFTGATTSESAAHLPHNADFCRGVRSGFEYASRVLPLSEHSRLNLERLAKFVQPYALDAVTGLLEGRVYPVFRNGKIDRIDYFGSDYEGPSNPDSEANLSPSEHDDWSEHSCNNSGDDKSEKTDKATTSADARSPWEIQRPERRRDTSRTRSSRQGAETRGSRSSKGEHRRPTYSSGWFSRAYPGLASSYSGPDSSYPGPVSSESRMWNELIAELERTSPWDAKDLKLLWKGRSQHLNMSPWNDPNRFLYKSPWNNPNPHLYMSPWNNPNTAPESARSRRRSSL